MKNGIIIPLNEIEFLDALSARIRAEFERQTLLASYEDEILTLPDVCKLLSISKPTLYSYIDRELIPSHTIGTRRFFLKSEIIAAMKQNKLGK